ncbi:MAG: hypothetical protein LUI61_03835 [Firmicutes bacterium]|nr:hypothetical protein [Bacillota bacterium]
MKRIISLVLCAILCMSVFMTTASAATTYTDYTWDLSSKHKEVWFADVVYNGEIVGFGYLHYSPGGWFTKSKLETEYQNYDLPRTLGTNGGINVTVYSYQKNDSGSASDKYAWSDSDYNGGNSLGWISAISKLSGQSTYLTGYVKLATSSGTNTYYYRVYEAD